MDDICPKPEFDNAAWVRIATKLDVKTLYTFCLRVEWLYRLNPYLRFEAWHQQDNNNFCATWENHSSDVARQIETCLRTETHENEICIKYQTGIKIETYFIIEPNVNASNVADLVIVDRYGSSESEKADEVDKSIHAWGLSLNRFFKHYVYIERIPYALMLIDRFWIRLSPMARRITYILLVITVVEVLALIMLALLLLLN